jgi:hypothetical protein
MLLAQRRMAAGLYAVRPIEGPGGVGVLVAGGVMPQSAG